MKGNKPILLKASYKDYLWGGIKLKDDYGQETEMSILAEAWVCSSHKDGESVYIDDAGMEKPLSLLLKHHPEYLGTHPQNNNGLPVLVKLIDAKMDLSIQVHPDDIDARRLEREDRGKTELWYVLHADKGAKLVYGFRHEVTKDIINKAIQNGTIERHLQYVNVNKDDVFLVNPGTVHAIGAGIVMAEIQQSSNLTYRMYDYNRVDKNGNKRDLHVEKALEVLNYNSSAEPRQPMRVLNYRNGYALELLGRCKYFQVERCLLNTERYKCMADYRTGHNSFRILLCIEGCGTLFGEDFMINFFKGDCIFIPADSIPLKLHGKAQLLSIGC